MLENRLYQMTNYDSNYEENFSNSNYSYNNTFRRYIDKTDILNALVNNLTTSNQDDLKYNRSDTNDEQIQRYKNISDFEEFKLNVLKSPFLRNRHNNLRNFTNELESMKHLLLLLSPHYTYHLSKVR